MDDIDTRIAKARETMSARAEQVLDSSLCHDSIADPFWDRSLEVLLAYEEERQRLKAQLNEALHSLSLAQSDASNAEGRAIKAEGHVAGEYRISDEEMTGLLRRRSRYADTLEEALSRAIRERDRAREALRAIVPSRSGQYALGDALADEEVPR